MDYRSARWYHQLCTWLPQFCVSVAYEHIPLLDRALLATSFPTTDASGSISI
jgi:hypothetical protein